MRRILIALLYAYAAAVLAHAERLLDYVDPRIGSEGLGRVFIGPCAPFGMVRPGPDCTPSPNSGWLPMPQRVDGFAQTHVSGTGGGPKYGNILVMPFSGEPSSPEVYAYRQSESILPAYYSTIFKDSGIQTEITASDRTSAYRINYPTGNSCGLKIDAGFFLGEEPVPDTREAQQFVGSEIQVLSDHEVAGYSRIRGGWNNGRAYTVYFHAVSDTPFADALTFKGQTVSNAATQYDSGEKTGAFLRFPEGTATVNLKVGISFISELKARHNYEAESEGRSFDEIRAATEKKWEDILHKIQIAPDTPDKYKRMFYTGIYHTMLMPSDRTGENPLWTDPGVPYYDDFYALWDTYRTSMPLLAITEPQRLADIVNSMVNICRRDGYMPDARSGNCNGRTQGGSNAEVVIADACVKGIKGIDYEAALQAMLVDATQPPGGNQEAEGRGGLAEYLRLGYIPHGIPRAGNRTVEYSLCDFAIHQVAEALGKKELAEKYLHQSESWKNLWRDDYEHDGVRGFIMPRDADGNWLDSLAFGHSRSLRPRYKYTPVTFEGPWYTPWWDMFFYEASSWEYSLSIPHDVEGLIGKCGGAEAFEARLDKFFDKGYFNVNNEPSFLSPCLYHWIGRPDKSGDRIRQIIADNYDDTPAGLPGNDDSGAMSSWLVFNMAGIYPNAGHDYYLIHTPLLRQTTFRLADGKEFTIEADGLSDTNTRIKEMYLNGKPYASHRLRHSDLSAGGTLRLVMEPARSVATTEPEVVVSAKTDLAPATGLVQLTDTIMATYKLHGQTRRFKFTLHRRADGAIVLRWNIVRNLRLWEGSYAMAPEAVESGTSLSLLMPEDGNNVALPARQTFAMISRKALADLVWLGEFIYDGVTYKKTGVVHTPAGDAIEATDPAEGTTMLILYRLELPLILSMRSNPLEINWTLSK